MKAHRPTSSFFKFPSDC